MGIGNHNTGGADAVVAIELISRPERGDIGRDRERHISEGGVYGIGRLQNAFRTSPAQGDAQDRGGIEVEAQHISGIVHGSSSGGDCEDVRGGRYTIIETDVIHLAIVRLPKTVIRSS